MAQKENHKRKDKKSNRHKIALISKLRVLLKRKKVRMIILAAISIIVVLVFILIITLRSSHSVQSKQLPKSPQSSQTDPHMLLTKPTKTAPPMTSDQAEQLSKDLSSGSETAVRSAVALPSGQTLDPDALQQTAALGLVNFDTSTFYDNNDGTATVTAHIINTKTNTNQTWTVQLLNVDGKWKISST